MWERKTKWRGERRRRRKTRIKMTMTNRVVYNIYMTFSTYFNPKGTSDYSLCAYTSTVPVVAHL